jgi:hypothetical protein
MAVALSLVLVVAGFLRVVAFGEGTTDALAISVALFLIVITSVVLGTVSGEGTLATVQVPEPPNNCPSTSLRHSFPGSCCRSS